MNGSSHGNKGALAYDGISRRDTAVLGRDFVLTAEFPMDIDPTLRRWARDNVREELSALGVGPMTGI